MGQKCGLKTMLCVQSLRYYLQTLAHRPFGHLTIPPIQPLLMGAEEALSLNFSVFGMTWPGIEPQPLEQTF